MSSAQAVRGATRSQVTGLVNIPHTLQMGVRVVHTVAAHGWPHRIFFFGHAPGDDLLCTAIFRELAKRGGKGIWSISQNGELLQGNPDVAAVLPLDAVSQELMYRFAPICVNPTYTGDRDWQSDHDPVPKAHIIALMCKTAGLSGPITLRPYYHMALEEKGQGRYFENQVSIQSGCMGGRMPMANKQWFPERFQSMVDTLKDRFNFVQVGSTVDHPLQGALDLRGKTSIRQLASVLSNSQLFVGPVTFCMHLARAVNTRSVIIYGGREHPWQSGYTCNENLYASPPCAPCWRWNTCDHDHICMRSISVRMAVEAVERLVERRRDPILDDEAIL